MQMVHVLSNAKKTSLYHHFDMMNEQVFFQFTHKQLILNSVKFFAAFFLPNLLICKVTEKPILAYSLRCCALQINVRLGVKHISKLTFAFVQRMIFEFFSHLIFKSTTTRWCSRIL